MYVIRNDKFGEMTPGNYLRFTASDIAWSTLEDATKFDSISDLLATVTKQAATVKSGWNGNHVIEEVQRNTWSTVRTIR